MKRFLIVISILLLSVTLVSADSTILVDRYHDSDNWWGNPETSARFLFDELSEMGFNYRVNDVPFTDQSLTGVDIVLMWDPDNPFDSGEVDALKRFVENGGSVILLVSNEIGMIDATRDSINLFLEPFGIRVMKNIVDGSEGCCGMPVFRHFAEHPTTEDVFAISLYRPASLEIKENAFAITKESEYAYAIGSEPLSGEDVVVVAASEKGDGKVLVIGSSFIFDNGKIGDLGNRDFAKNIFTWLGSTQEQKTNPLPLYMILVFLIVISYLAYRYKKRSKK